MRKLVSGSVFVLAVLTVIQIGHVAARSEMNVRVVNGWDVDISAYPYMVSMRRESGAHTCGGTLISPTWILGSSICVFRPGTGGPTGETFSFQHSSTRISENAIVNISQIAETITHPNFLPYVDVSFIHDVTLFRLSQPVNVARYAILPAQFSDISGGTPGLVIGWGLNETEPVGVIQENLQEANVFVLSDEDCRSRHQATIHASQICTFNHLGRAHCRGDAGSPLIVNGIQVGIYSMRDGPCGELPKIYTQVSYYREWIRQITGV